MTDLSPREKALVEAVRAWTKYVYGGNLWAVGMPQQTTDVMQALRAYDPPKPDADVLAVRTILHAEQRAMTPPDSGWGDMSYEKGSYDHLPSFKAALAAYRSIRTLTSKEAE